MVIKIRTIIGRNRQCPQGHSCSKFTNRSYKNGFLIDGESLLMKTPYPLALNMEKSRDQEVSSLLVSFCIYRRFYADCCRKKKFICEPWKLQSWPVQGMSMGAIVVWISYAGTNHILNGFKVFPIKRNSSHKSGQETNSWWSRPLPQAVPVRASPLGVYGKHKLTWWVIKKEKKNLLEIEHGKGVYLRRWGEERKYIQ